MSDELMKKPEPFKLRQPVGLAAKKKAAAALDPARAAFNIPPAEMPERIGIVFDDSGSMSHGYPKDPIDDAHAGCEEFLRSCKPGQTAVTVYPMNADALHLSTDLPALAVLIDMIPATGGTPALETLEKMLDNEKITRAIMFSDGGYSDYSYGRIVAKCKAKKIPVDTVFIGNQDSIQMQRLAEATGGYYLHFRPGLSSFRESFKYLAPAYRTMLADKSFVDKITGK